MKRLTSIFVALALIVSLSIFGATSASAAEVTYFETQVDFYDITGDKIHSVSGFGDDVSPVFSVSVTETGCTVFRASDGLVVYTYVSSGDFSGFALVPGGDIVYSPGDQFDVGGGESVELSLYDISAVPEDMTFLEWVTSFFENLDLSVITDFFSEAWKNLTSLFGLVDVFNDPDGPFAWLSGASGVADENGFVSGLSSVWSAFGDVGDALPKEVVNTISFVFCGFLIVGLLRLF